MSAAMRFSQMMIDLKKYFSGEDIAQAIAYDLDLSAVEIDGFRPFVSPVRVEGELRAFASSAELNVTASYTYSMPCHRCMTETAKEITRSISHVLVRHLNDEADSDDYIVVEDEKLDLDELLYSDILLLTPSKYLCREDCKGLCATCGKNLNEGACACQKQQTDPRLEALRQLLN